jgi:hypothetical protein
MYSYFYFFVFPTAKSHIFTNIDMEKLMIKSFMLIKMKQNQANKKQE